MSFKIEPVKWRPGVGGYVPDEKLGGESPTTAYAGENVIFSGRDGVNAARGALDTGMSGATSTLANNIALTAASETANMTSGAFLTDCVPYQFFEANGLLFLTNEIISNTQIKIGPKPAANYTGAMKLVPTLHALDTKRATMLAGNVVKYLQCLWAVGRGVVRVDGAAISDSLTATSQPKVAYAETNTSYDVREVGFTRPAAPTVTAVSGGTKSLPALLRSVRFSKKRAGELGYGPASEPVLVDMSGAASQMMHATLAAYDTGEGQNRWLAWVTKDEVSTSQGGPWFEYGEIDADNTTFDIEYRSGELGTAYVEDYTNKPDPAVCVAAAGDVLLWGGALALDASGNPSIPGDVIEVSSPSNPEGYPADAYTGMVSGESIITIKVGKVQLYAFAANSVQYALLTQGTREPLALLPYLQTGIRHQYNACIGADILVIFTDGKLVAFYDRTGIVQEPILFKLANDCASLLKSFPAERTFVGYDPANEHFVVLCSNYRQHDDGGWQTIALSFDMRVGRTNTPVFLGNGTDNFTVCGVATVNNHLEFTTTDGKIWRWEAGTGEITGWLASPFSSFGSNMQRTTVRAIAVVGKLDGAVSIVSDLDDATLNLAELTGVDTEELTNPPFVRTRFPVWSPNVQGDSHSIRVDFTAAAGAENVLELVEVGVMKRDGAEN